MNIHEGASRMKRAGAMDDARSVDGACTHYLCGRGLGTFPPRYAQSAWLDTAFHPAGHSGRSALAGRLDCGRLRARRDRARTQPGASPAAPVSAGAGFRVGPTGRANQRGTRTQDCASLHPGLLSLAPLRERRTMGNYAGALPPSFPRRLKPVCKS